MVTKDGKNKTNSPKVEVGEIDTRAPFQSVKDAVNLFGEGAFSGEKPTIKKIKPHSAERVLAKETKLHLAEKELNKLKEQLKNAETTKSEAILELERAKRTLAELTNKLQTVNEAKDSAIKATETIKNQADQIDNGVNGVWKHDPENTKEQYTAVVTELNAAKQELRKLHQDHGAAMEAKAGALRLAMEADVTKKVNLDRAGELSKEITSVQEGIEQVKLATIEAEQEQAKIYSEKNVQKLSHKAALEEVEKKLVAMRKEVDPEITKDLETRLAETTLEIERMQKEMEDSRGSDRDALKNVTVELDGAKGSLQKVAEEENALKNLLESLKMELENVKKEKAELEEKEAETESVAGKLHDELRKRKSELEAARLEEVKVKGVSDEMVSSLEQLCLESENAKRESEEMEEETERLKKEAEAMGGALEEAERKLKVAIEEAEEAKAAESKALEEIKVVSERTDIARASVSETGSRITMSREEYESLSRKVEESEKLAAMRVEAAMAQAEAVRASEYETLKRLEAAQMEIDEMRAATEAAVKKAEMAEAAKKAVEGELRRWREREQKKAAEAAARILQETQVTPVHVQNSPQRVVNVQKFEKSKSKSKTKKVLVSNLSGVFQRKKSLIDGGSSPSYLPGEKTL